MKKARETADYISRNKVWEKLVFFSFFWSFLQNWLKFVMIVRCLNAGGAAKVHMFCMKKCIDFNHNGLSLLSIVRYF